MTDPADLTPKDTAERIVEAEVNRRVAAIVKDQELDRKFAQILARLDKANGLKAAMVTNERFDAFEKRLEDRLHGFVSVQDLGDGDFWVKHGVVTLDPEEQQVLKQRIELDSIAEHNRHSERVESGLSNTRTTTRAMIGSALFSGLMCIIAVLAWLHPKFS